MVPASLLLDIDSSIHVPLYNGYLSDVYLALPVPGSPGRTGSAKGSGGSTGS